MWNSLKGVGAIILGIAVIIGLPLLGVVFIYGATWVAQKIYPWLLLIFSFTFLIALFVLLPMALFHKTRRFASVGIVIASFVFGLTLWVWAMLLTYNLWGLIALIIGLLFMGFGVVPIAMLATLLNGMWSTLGQLVLLTVLTFGARFGGILLAEKADKDR